MDPIRKLHVFELRNTEINKRIERYSLIDETQISEDQPHSVFEGIGHVLVQVDEQVFPQEIKFSIQASSIEEAFSMYDESAIKEIERLKEEQEKKESAIITPDDMFIGSNKGIIGS